MTDTAAKPTREKKSSPFGFLRHLYAQVLVAIAIGVILGHYNPELGAAMKPLSDGFIKLVKMIIGPIIFCTVVTGIASMDHMKDVGRVGLKAMAYFFILSLLSLIIGLLAAHYSGLGIGMNVNPETLQTDALKQTLSKTTETESTADFLLHIIPNTFVGAMTGGAILQVLFVALLFAAGCAVLGESAKPVVKLVSDVGHVCFAIIGFLMKLAPFGAFGAMAFTVGTYGIATLLPLGKLLLLFYGVCLLFIFVLLGGIMRWAGLSLWGFLRYIREEILIVLGTSSSETALPRMIDKLTALGCARPVVGMVLPTGYSFNLDGSAIYLSLAAVFLAQATNTPMTLAEEAGMVALMMLTLKGAAGVTGSGFIALAATLTTMDTIPVAALALILGIDRFMSEGRAVTNLIGNGVATVFVAKWEKSLDITKARRILDGQRKARLESE
jgi:aerobic C4-dicarboxylate transport protein